MNKIVTILVAAMLILVSATYSQTSLTLTPTEVTGNTGETVTVQVVVSNFTDIISMQFGIKWDPAVLQFDAVDNLNLVDLSTGNFNANNTNGFLSFSWFESGATGATVSDGESVFDISFTVLGDASSGSMITFESRLGLPIEFIDPSGEITNAVTLTNSQFGDPNGNGGGGTGNTDPLVSGISSSSGEKGTTVCVNVNVSNFTDLTEMKYSLNWDESVLQFDEIKSINLAGLTQSSFDTATANAGQLSMNWSNAVGTSTTDGTNIYQVCYNLIGNKGTNSAVSFSSTPTPISIITTASATSVGITQSNGTISINNTTVTPPPAAGDKLVNIAALNTTAGATICVPITVNDFNGIASLQFSLAWDPNVLQFSEVKGFNLQDLTAGNFNTEQTASGRLALAWFDNAAQGLNLQNGAIVFEVCFTVLGADGVSTNITFTDVPTSREAATSDNTIPFTETNGSVTVGDGVINPPPPTTGGDKLVNIGTLNAKAGSTVCVPITVNDFDGIASLQFSLAWDPAILQFDDVQNFNLPDLAAGNFNIVQASNGQVAVAWFDNAAQGVTLQDGATIFEICFTVLGATGTSSTIVFSDVPTQREAATANNTITFTETNGGVSVDDGIIQPPPSGDGIINIGAINAAAGSTICVPITANNFDSIAAMQFSLAWDPAVLSFTGTQTFGLPDLSASSFNISGTDNGQIAVAWFDNSTVGVTLADDAIIFELCFTVVGSSGTSTNITFTDIPTARELATASGTINFLSTNGSLTVINNVPTGDGILNIDTIRALPGSTVCIPITAKDFDAIAAMQFSLAWDPTVLQFTETRNFGLSDLNAGSFNIGGTSNGQIAVAWFDNSAVGVTIADGTPVFEICFTVIGTDGASTSIRFTDSPTVRELATATGTIDFSSSDGTFIVENEIDPPVGSLVNIAPITVMPGAEFCVPITVNDFDGLAALQFSLGWDPTVLEFTGVQAFGLPDMSAGSFNVAGAANGAISAVWTDNTALGITVSDGITIFEICFKASGNEGSTLLAFTDTPTSKEAATPNNTIPFTGSNGLITLDGGVECSTISAIPSNPTNVSCNGANDGALSITTTGGDGNYTYQWSDPNIGNIPNPTGLTAGIYSVTISGCGNQQIDNLPVALLTILEPPAVVTVVTPQDASCFGEADGRINVSITGGTLPYTYAWSEPTLAPLNRPVNAVAGTYSLTITDGNGCEGITQNIVVASPSPVSVAITTTSASCSGIPDGTATLEVTGGSGSGYSYNWGNAAIVGAAPTNVIAGDYTVTITDGDQCTSEIAVTVGATINISGTVQVIEDACGDGKGGIQVTATGGAEPYTYVWTGPVNVDNTNNTIENVPTGTYSVTGTDANGCFFTIDNIEVGGPTAILSASATIVDVDCPEDSDGSITITGIGGFSPYTYAWNNNSTSATIGDLTPGTYTVTVSDSKVCTYIDTFIVKSNSNLAIEVTILQGAPNGSASVTVTGGSPTYTYLWCNGQTTQTATDLDEGVCSVTVIDALGCSVVQTVTIEVDNPEPTVLVSNPISCNGATDGILQVDISPGTGTGPFTYTWSTGATGNILVNVGGGTYGVTVTDAGGNTGMTSFNFTEPTPIIIDLIENKSSCMEDGRIEISLSGGTMPYSIAWSKGENDKLAIDNLIAGEYGVIVTDSNDCTSEESFRIISDPECIQCYTSLKVMTPNEDGRNDAFFINCVDLAKNNHLQVFNRWGQLIFEANNYQCVLGTESDCWRGRSRTDRVVDEGGYFWVLEFDGANGRTRIRDHITIMRED